MQFEIAGDLRFLSHHDTMRMFERAAIRAGLALRYSGGFNPSPTIALPLPRPVGIVGREEWLLLHLTEPLSPAELVDRLVARMPEGVRIRDCAVAPGGASWQVAEAHYEVALPEDLAEAVLPRIEQIMAATSAIVDRQVGPGKRPKTVDARWFVVRLELRERQLHIHTRFEAGATVRPSEVLELLGVPALPHASRVVRTRIIWGPRDLSDQPVLSDQSRPAKEAGSE